MKAWRFVKPNFDKQESSLFEQLLELFKDLLMHTGGDVPEAIAWLTELDNTYELTSEEYGIPDFIQDLIDKGFIRESDGNGGFSPSRKMDIAIRQKALDEVFGQVAKFKQGRHLTNKIGSGDERTSELRPFEFGDGLDRIAFSESLKNAQINHGIDHFNLTEQDLEIYETFQQSRSSSVLMIDISHSMILYGEDRITPAKKVALALTEYIKRNYPQDTLDIVVFGNTAWQIELKEVPYLQVGPYHTNTVAGLELALELLRKRKNPNKQVFMITDGKPTCIKKGNKLYKNPFGLDRQIINRTLGLANRFRKLDIPITTFMIASDPYLQEFVEKFTEVNQGKAFYSSLDQLGEFVLKDYRARKSRK